MEVEADVDLFFRAQTQQRVYRVKSVPADPAGVLPIKEHIKVQQHTDEIKAAVRNDLYLILRKLYPPVQIFTQSPFDGISFPRRQAFETSGMEETYPCIVSSNSQEILSGETISPESKECGLSSCDTPEAAVPQDGRATTRASNMTTAQNRLFICLIPLLFMIYPFGGEWFLAPK